MNLTLYMENKDGTVSYNYNVKCVNVQNGKIHVREEINKQIIWYEFQMKNIKEWAIYPTSKN